MTIQTADPYADRALAADMAERLGLRESAVEGGHRWAGTVSGAQSRSSPTRHLPLVRAGQPWRGGGPNHIAEPPPSGQRSGGTQGKGNR